jgi:replicative DNA helicase
MSYVAESKKSELNLDMKTISPARDIVKSLGEELATRSAVPELPLKTLPGFSDAMFGLPTKSLVCVAARTSQGKSAFTCQILYDLASQGFPCVYMSLEMTPHSVMERMFCLHSLVSNRSIQRGGFSKYQKEWSSFGMHMKQSRLMVADGLGKTWRELDQMIEDFGTKPRVVVLDYIQMINGAGVERKEVIDEYLKHFRRLAIQNDFCAIVVSQINRASESSKDHVPHLWNLSGTSGLEDISDRVLLLHWPHHYDNSLDINNYDVYVAKNRAGKTGKYSLRFVPDYYKFEEPTLIHPPNQRIADAAKMFNSTEIIETTI